MVHLLHSHIIFRDYVKEAALDLVRAFTPHAIVLIWDFIIPPYYHRHPSSPFSKQLEEGREYLKKQLITAGGRERSGKHWESLGCRS